MKKKISPIIIIIMTIIIFTTSNNIINAANSDYENGLTEGISFKRSSDNLVLTGINDNNETTSGTLLPLSGSQFYARITFTTLQSIKSWRINSPNTNIRVLLRDSSDNDIGTSILIDPYIDGTTKYTYPTLVQNVKYILILNYNQNNVTINEFEAFGEEVTPTPSPSTSPTPAPTASPTPAPSTSPTPAPSTSPTPAPSTPPSNYDVEGSLPFFQELWLTITKSLGTIERVTETIKTTTPANTQLIVYIGYFRYIVGDVNYILFTSALLVSAGITIWKIVLQGIQLIRSFLPW